MTNSRLRAEAAGWEALAGSWATQTAWKAKEPSQKGSRMPAMTSDATGSRAPTVLCQISKEQIILLHSSSVGGQIYEDKLNS